MSYNHSSHTSRYRTPLKLGVILIILLTPFAAAQAYVGPGAGLSLLSALWGLLCAIGAAFLFVILWPLRRLRRKRREARQATRQADNQAEETPQTAAGRTRHRESDTNGSRTGE